MPYDENPAKGGTPRMFVVGKQLLVASSTGANLDSYDISGISAIL